MKRIAVVLALICCLTGRAHAGLFDWVPNPKDVLNGVADAFGNVWDGVQDFVIDPIFNVTSDGVEFITEKVVDALGLAPDVAAEMKKVIDANIDKPFAIQVIPADATDGTSGLFVITDPFAHKVFFKDDVHLVSIDIPNVGSKKIPAMGFFGNDGNGRFIGEPRGIATDRDRNFWVADWTLGRVWSLFYDPVEKALKYSGSVTGFEGPYGVAFSRGVLAGRGDDMIYVTNTASNSICRLPANLGVDQELRTLPGYFCSSEIGGNILANPRAIATEDNNAIGAEGSPTVIYVAYDGNKVARVEDIGDGFALTASVSVETEATVKFTGLATDLSGNLYAVDNLGSRVFYFRTSPDEIEEVFAFGEPGFGSTVANVKFNNPTGIAVSGTDVYVVEEWTASSGLQKFKAVPTIDRNNTHIEVSLDVPGKMEVNAKISTKGRVSIELALYDDLATMANPTVVWIKNPTDLPVFYGGQGTAVFPMVGNTGAYNGLPLPENRLYRMTVKSYLVDNLTSPVDVFVNDMVLALPGQQQPFTVQMKDNASSGENMSKPEIMLTNSSSQAIENFTVRFWLNREEFPSQLLTVDKYYTNPEGISHSIGYHPVNPNVVFIDFKYPTGYVLSPGATTLDQGFQWGIHFENYWPGVWDRANDFSWLGISSTYSLTRNVSVFDAGNRILYGDWPTVIPPPISPEPAPSSNPLLGFEDSDDWTSGQATLSLNTASRTEGNASLQISGGGWMALSSANLSTSEIANETSRIALDVLVPTPQANPWWAGSVNFFASCPSAGFTNAFLGHYEFTTLPQAQFNTLVFNVPQSVLAALQGNFSDFSFRFEFSMNAGAQVLLDNLRFINLPSGARSISGNISGAGAGVSVSLTGTQAATAVTDASGNYSIDGLTTGGTFSLMPSKAGYTFNPPGRSFSNLQANTIANFSATLPSVWQPNTLYAIGIVVTYEGVQYQSIRGHTSQTGWEPPFVPAIWQATVAPPSGTLPSPWSARDVGSVAYSGTASYGSNTYTLKGSGADIWGTADAFHFAYQPLEGNMEIKARVTGVQNTDSWAKAGIMLRESLSPNSPHAFMLVSSSAGLAFQRRTSQGASSLSSGVSGTAPRWVRLTRVGNVVTAYWSANGLSWNEVGAQEIPMAGTLYVGLAVTSHNNTALCEAGFTNVSVAQIGGSPWTQTDIGAVGLSGNTTVAGSSGNVTGSGSDIWGTVDAFTYVHKPLKGDGSIVARVSSVQNTNAWAKAGVMIREGLAPNSSHAQMVVSAASGLSFQYRPSPGGNSQSSTVSGSAPSWIRLERAGNQLTGYRSQDGVNWVQVGNTTISMGPVIYVGLAVTSHNNSALCTAGFGNILVVE